MAVKEVKICLLGESGVGKSSIVYRFVYGSFRPTMESTIGASFMTKTITLDKKTYKYQIWDTAGQEKYRALAPMYYRGAAAAIVVYDITRESSFASLKTWISELQKHGSPNTILAMAGNKCDLDDLREVQHREALRYAESHGAMLVETSAKTAANIAALFMEISRKLSSVEDIASNPSLMAIHLHQHQEEPKENRKKCC
ncbi:Ras-related protein Rab-22A [Lamellibrachia satsuma]|nr:Ras-related protein Rab-22A [Lamellibrachia satsuma]